MFGVHFAYERDTVLQKNFWDKLISLKKKKVKHMVSKGHFCLRQNKSSEIPRALQTGIYLAPVVQTLDSAIQRLNNLGQQCNGNSKSFC